MSEQQKKIMAEISKEEGAIDWEAMTSRDQHDIFLPDTPQEALDKLLKVNEFTINERMVYAKHLGELFEIMGDMGFENIGVIFDHFLKDSDEIKRQLIVQITPIFHILQKQDNGQDIIQKILIPTLIQLIEYHNLDVQEEAAKQIIEIGKFMTEPQKQEYLIKQVQKMSKDHNNEDNLIVASQLFGSLTSVLGKQLTEDIILGELITLGTEHSQRVKKAVINSLVSVINVVGQDSFKNRILPFYLDKCQEKIWQVRKVCVETIDLVSNHCTQEVKDLELTNQMIQFLKDNNKWVKAAAYLNLGKFIETLKNSKKPSLYLLNEFCRMTSNDVKDCFNSEEEALKACSFNFPAVCRTYVIAPKLEKWPQMLKLYMTLLNNTNPNVRRPLSFGLHEIAKIIGCEQADQDLIQVLDMILKDKNDDVKCGVIENLWQFLQVFDYEKRENLLDVFQILQRDLKKWRVRELIARQIQNLTTIFNAETIFKIIVPISMKLCNDVVAEVRKQASRNIFSLIKSFENDPDEMSDVYKQCVVENVKAFATSSRFSHRQIYIRMCKSILDHSESLFEAVFLDPLLVLAKDKVPLVRIGLAKMVSQHICSEGKFINHPKFLEIHQILQEDKCQEVYNMLHYKAK